MGRVASRCSIGGAASLVLDVNHLRRHGVTGIDERRRSRLEHGRMKLTLAASTWKGEGEVLVYGEVSTCAHGRFRVDERVELITTPAGFGGKRFWFRCPRSGCRVSKLFLPNGATQFASRVAYRLVYESSRMDDAQRLWHRARQRRTKLGGIAESSAPYPEKPKRMRWTTFNAALSRIERWEEDANAQFAVTMARHLPVLRAGLMVVGWN